MCLASRVPCVISLLRSSDHTLYYILLRSRTSLHFEAVYMEPDGPVRVRVRNESLFKGVQINDKVLESFRWYLLQVGGKYKKDLQGPDCA